MVHKQKTRIKLILLFLGSILMQACYHALSKENFTEKSAFDYKVRRSLNDTIPDSFGFGRKATKAEIERLDIDIRPDGKGLPAGTGVVSKGKLIFETKCAMCHGTGGIGGPNGSLVTDRTSNEKRREKTIGNYWPYATTVFDYIRRAMPFNAPGSLSNEEVYHLTAYLLRANNIIDEKAIVNAHTLPKIEMPAKNSFVPDDRKGGSEIR